MSSMNAVLLICDQSMRENLARLLGQERFTSIPVREAEPEPGTSQAPEPELLLVDMPVKEIRDPEEPRESIPVELLARIRTVLRRIAIRLEATTRFGGVEVNLDRQTVTRNGEEVPVCRAEYKLLVFFLQNADRPLAREEILQRVWGYHSSHTRTVDVHVARLRSKLEENPDSPKHIVTVHRLGYRFVR